MFPHAPRRCYKRIINAAHDLPAAIRERRIKTVEKAAGGPTIAPCKSMSQPSNGKCAVLSPGQTTGLLRAWSDGDESALEALIPMVYEELHRLARLFMSRERPGLTLQPTALVNEAYLRLVDVRRVRWQDRTHFFAFSARLMRRVLVDMARSRASLKRAGGVHRVSFDEGLVAANEWSASLVTLDDALDALARHDERKSRVIELRFFGGLDVNETAEALGVSPRTVMRDWRLARAWLSRELAKDQTP